MLGKHLLVGCRSHCRLLGLRREGELRFLCHLVALALLVGALERVHKLLRGLDLGLLWLLLTRLNRALSAHDYGRLRRLASGRDLKLKVINNLLDLWLGELLDLLDNESEVLSHLRALHQALLVAGLMVVNQLAEDLLSVL